MCKIKSLLILFLILTSKSLQVFAQQKSIDQRVDSLLRLMSIEEKVGQLNQLSGKQVTGPVTKSNTDLLNDIKAGRVGSMLNVKGAKDTREIQKVALQSRLRIPLLFSLDVIHGYKTVFPIPLAEACSWDMPAIQRSAHIAAKEAAASGIHWTFAPMVDVARDPRWGRVMEGAGEDTYLGSIIAKARVIGFQGTKLGGTDAVMACAKHFAAYGAAIAGRDYNAVDLSKQQLLETYLPPFKAANDAGVATFMNSFNTVNGVPATGNKYLQRNILKDDWKFKGFVVSDWASIAEMTEWGYAADNKDAALKAISAGSDMDMEGRIYLNNLVGLVKSGRVESGLIDDAVKRILYKKFELGLFDDPFKFCNEQREKKVLNDPEHRTAALDIARKSIVLLKNEGAILPLKKDLKSVALIGPLMLSKRDHDGSWVVYADTAEVVSVAQGLKHKAGKKTDFLYARGCGITDSDSSGFAAAVEAAKKAEIVVMTLGESWDMSGEAKSRTDISLAGIQERLFSTIKATGKPVIVVMMAGRPLVFNEIASKADAVVYAWWLGSEAGNAIADVLYGNYNPSGKFPITFPRSVGQIPISYNYYNTGRPVKNPNNIIYKSAYIDSPNSPLYAFGHGLSYTTFSYSDLKITKSAIRADQNSEVSFTLTNSGKVAGEEIVQLYIQDMVASVVRPVKELKDFRKIPLKPGESKTIRFSIDKEKLSFFNGDLKWDAEPGDFKLMVGSSSDNIRLEGNLKYEAAASVQTN